jgi:hypothetical protein
LGFGEVKVDYTEYWAEDLGRATGLQERADGGLVGMDRRKKVCRVSWIGEAKVGHAERWAGDLCRATGLQGRAVGGLVGRDG